jgi:uncharacterized protein involved in exopolysaccharide biosynthesis
MNAPANRERQTAQLNTELEILRSRDLIEEGDSRRCQRPLPGDQQEARPSHPAELRANVDRFGANLSAERIRDADVLRIAFRHPDPELTAKALNLLVEHFKAKHLRAYGDAWATAFLEEKVTGIRSQLQKAEDKLN